MFFRTLQAERNWLISQLQQVAHTQHVRISFLSGDVHCAAVGVLKTLTKGKAPDIDPTQDPRYMLNVSPVPILRWMPQY